ncbi:nuclear pore membrane glycoprotein 210-like [Halichondria panicea]|uniref:nuclear pore membrane glycoprotein 210-like n=1 Tax=Halichondria panicea TaxID=6063 RepID=UPI00312BA2F0
MMLQPSMDICTICHVLSFVEYRVERRKHGRSEVITIPSQQYSLELTNTTVQRLHPQRSRVTELVVGYTEAILQDINMLHTPSASKPSAGIHVVPPHHLGFSIAPGNNWMLEVGRDYAITVNVFDKMNHKIIITENLLFRACFHDDTTSDWSYARLPSIDSDQQSQYSAPNIYTENEQVAKYEIIAGWCSSEGGGPSPSIPIRLFLAGYNLTPTMRDINKKFSVRYYLNLVLVDEEERRYFKYQQEIVLWRKEKPWKSVTKY